MCEFELRASLFVYKHWTFYTYLFLKSPVLNLDKYFKSVLLGLDRIETEKGH